MYYATLPTFFLLQVKEIARGISGKIEVDDTNEDIIRDGLTFFFSKKEVMESVLDWVISRKMKVYLSVM